MTKISSLFLAFLLLAFSAVAQAETSIPALMTGPENLARPGQAVTTTVVTAHGSQYGVTLRLDEIRFRMNFSFVDSLKGARLRFQDSGMFQVFAMRPDLMEDSIAWLALE